ncbi:hypothetical protein ACFP1Z_31835 [Streptomyces gamaensis]|uniref:Uncharacterized protein n=1 Tax=Streptomyces gamaensis TaxID=1763542 RepID=A0ABW0ZDV7_9ACTN
MGDAPEPREKLLQWAEEGHRNALELAGMLGVPTDAYACDPLTLAPALQNYVSRLPLGQFEQSDWATLHADLTSYVADVLVHSHGARWQVAEDARGPLGFRYVIEVQGLDGSTRRIDPADAVLAEFRDPPIEITRMLASAEPTLGLSHRLDGE